jgi:hypothetical protein
MLALKMCSLAREVPDPELTVTSQGTGSIMSLASSSVKGSPKMVFFGLLAMFESKWDKSVMVYFLSLGTVGEGNAVSGKIKTRCPGEYVQMCKCADDMKMQRCVNGQIYRV